MSGLDPIGRGQIIDMNIVANTRTSTGRPVDAGQIEDGFTSESDFYQLADQMAGVANVQPCAHFRVCSNGVEVAQGDGIQSVGAAKILEHHFHHVLSPGVGAEGAQRGVFGHHKTRNNIVNSG